MAYATLLSLTQTLELILHPPVDDDQVPLLQPTDQQIMGSLQKKLSCLLSFLEDTPLTYGETIQSLEGRIRDAAYEAEAIIESYLSNLILSESKVHPIYDGLQKTVEDMDSILEEVVKMKDETHTVYLPQSQSLPAASSSSKLGSTSTSDVVGFQEKLMEIKHQLIGGPSKRQIISIVGMGGIGKTTLAKTIFNDSVIVQHFDTRAWTTVSHDYQVQHILVSLLGSMKNHSHESFSEDKEKLKELLYKKLKGRRYLIVMDDLWDTNALNEIKMLFPDDKEGSRIILTTRMADVAVSADSSSHIHRPSLLSPYDSWKMLCLKAFGQDCRCPPQLEKIGKEIAVSCKGLPLALAVIGGLLCKAEKTLDCWMYVKQNVNSLVNNSDDQFTEILSLSYKQLPHHLRACFLYLGVFPEDFEILKSKLIHLWVAEGFIKSDRSRSLEEVAEKYLEDLIGRNMIEIRKRNYLSEVETCGIHDLMRDLCVRIAEQEKFLHAVYSQIEKTLDNTYSLDNLLSYSDSNDHPVTVCGINVRSLLCFGASRSGSRIKLSRILSSGQSRVVDAQDICFNEFPLRMLEMVNLRYLACILEAGNKLPSSTSKLLNLQLLCVDTIDIHLPLDIWKMKRLRHIITKSCFLPQPCGAQNEENTVLWEDLQTLKKVRNFRFTKEVLQMMPNLKTLGIRLSCDSDTDLSFYGIDNFVHLHRLEDLSCFFEGNSASEYGYPLDNFALPSSLRKLHLEGGVLLSLKNMAIIGSLPNLESLGLVEVKFDGQSWEPSEGEFRQLKSLKLSRTDLEHLIADETSFPSLRCLIIKYCRSLAEIPSRIAHIPTLELIEYWGYKWSSCWHSVQLIKDEQHELENYSLQIVDLSLSVIQVAAIKT